MKTFWLKTLWFVVGKLVGNATLLNNILEFVAEAMRLDISGAEKKARVLKELRDIGADLAGIGAALINLAIEAAVQLVKAKSEQRG